MDRPDLADIRRYLDELDAARLEARRLLEDLADVEDSPETDAEILRRVGHDEWVEYVDRPRVRRGR